MRLPAKWAASWNTRRCPVHRFAVTYREIFRVLYSGDDVLARPSSATIIPADCSRTRFQTAAINQTANVERGGGFSFASRAAGHTSVLAYASLIYSLGSNFILSRRGGAPSEEALVNQSFLPCCFLFWMDQLSIKWSCWACQLDWDTCGQTAAWQVFEHSLYRAGTHWAIHL